MSTHIWRATDYEFVIQSGRTKPLVVWCEDTDGQEPPQRFLVKSPGHPETLESNLFAELFGILLAREFGILTPLPALIELTPPFVRAVQPILTTEAPQIQLRPGYGVGAGYLTPLQPLLSNSVLPPALLSQASLVYAFDLLVANPDRRIGNPNCALQGTNLLAYDFEQSFSFLLALAFFSPKPWEVSKLGIAERHVFQAQLGKSGADWSPFIEKLKMLDARRLDELVKDFPTSWLAQQQRIFDHLLDAQEHPDKLALELEKSLLVQPPFRR